MDVNGVPVKTTSEVKSKILEALHSRGTVSTVFMRPMTEKSLEIVR
jgi:hypothetical protein